MAITVSQSATGQISGANSLGITLSGVIAGHSLVLLIALWNNGSAGSAFTVVDNVGNTWFATPATITAGAFGTHILWTPRSNGGNVTVTVGLAAGAYASAQVFEAGNLALSAVDQVATNTDTSSTTCTTTSSPATTQADEIVFALSHYSFSGPTPVWTTPTGYTAGFVDGGGGATEGLAIVYKIVNTTGAQVADWSPISPAVTTYNVLATFKQDSSPGTADMVAVTTTTTGSGAYALGSPLTGFMGVSGLVDGALYGYFVEDGTGQYEATYGYFSASGVSLTRAQVDCSSNSNNPVVWGAGTKTIRIDALSQELQSLTTIFTSNGNWTPQITSTLFQADVCGAGGGGGGGQCATSGGQGGGGGGGGGRHIIRGRISDLSTPVAVTVGTAGTSGNGPTAVGNGGDGGGGGASSFGTYAHAYGGGAGSGGTGSLAGGGGGGAGYLGAGGNSSAGGAGAAGSGGGVAGGAAAGGFGTIAQTSFGGAGGGAGGLGTIGQGGAAVGGGSGGGAGCNSFASPLAGANSGATNWSAAKTGTTGAAGTAGSSSFFANGQGGSGGGNIGLNGQSGEGFAGGNGGTPGGGGGGGAGSGSSAPAGAGGVGGAGQVRVTEW